jgi:hypothetical protein
MLPETVLTLGKRYIRLGRNPAEKIIAITLDPVRAPVTALLSRCHTMTVAPLLNPGYRRLDTDLKASCRFTAGMTGLDPRL